MNLNWILSDKNKNPWMYMFLFSFGSFAKKKKKKSPEKNSVILFEMFVTRINSHRTSLDEGYHISYLGLRILVLAIGVSVLTWLGGLDTGRI